jgi:NCS1 family nucleobase:cation symporter-1
MVAIALSGSFSWASYGSDYSRYCKTGVSRATIFWCTLGGLSLSYVWLSFIGLAAASVLSDQTAGGIRTLVGGGALGYVALAAIFLAAFISSAINDYSGSLAFQALQARVKRPLGSAIAALIALGIILWMHAGNLTGRFENVLLFTGYWLSPFVAIVLYDWYRHRSSYDWERARSVLNWRALPFGWPALISFAVGFGAMVPFMDTSLIVGPAAKSLDGADIAYYVGFAVTGILYVVLCRIADETTARGSVTANQGTDSGTLLSGAD